MTERLLLDRLAARGDGVLAAEQFEAARADLAARAAADLQESQAAPVAAKPARQAALVAAIALPVAALALATAAFRKVTP